MRKPLLTLIAGVSLVGLPRSGALADEKPVAGEREPTRGERETKPARADETRKHFGEIDAYLTDAMNNAKVLYQLTQLAPGRLDATIHREGIGNIDQSIAGALTHLAHVKTLPEAAVADPAKVDEMQRGLMQARAMLSQLRTAARTDKRDELASLTAQLYQKLKATDEEFSVVAEKQGMMRLDKIVMPERQAVGGREEITPARPKPKPKAKPEEMRPPETPPIQPTPEQKGEPETPQPNY